MQVLLTIIVLFGAFQLGLSVPVVTQSSEAATVSELITANGQAERINMLNDSDFVFDFFHPLADAVSSTGPDGHVIAAKLDNFPVLVGEGIAMSIGYLGPCGLNTPHFHPRATEFNFVVNGTARAGMLQENGVRVVLNDLSPGQATIFPRGSIHFEQNLGCEPLIFVAAFSSEDPGTTSLANNFFRLPSDVVLATLGAYNIGQDVEHAEMEIPTSVAFGVQECLQRCGITQTS